MAATVTSSESICREFAKQYPTENVRAAIAYAESGRLSWGQIERLFQRSLGSALAEVA